MDSFPARQRHRLSGTTLAVIGALADLAVAVALGYARTTNSQIGERRAEGPLPTTALVIVLAAPGVVALLGVVIDRPVLFGVAGVACMPLALVSILAVPIWIPAAVLMLAFVRTSAYRPPSPAMSTVLVFAFTALLFVALRILITGNGQYTYTFAGGSEGGDYFLPRHAVTCIAIVAVDVVLVTSLARVTQSSKQHAVSH